MDEKTLRSWQPRPPSAALKRRLLRPAQDQEMVPDIRWLWRCLAPTMACALLALVALNHDGVKETVPMALILHNQDNAAFASGGASSGQNHLAAVTFDWTNQSVFQSSIRFTPTTNLTN